VNKVLLVQLDIVPERTPGKLFRYNIRSPFRKRYSKPLGVAYLSSSLLRRGIENEILDLNIFKRKKGEKLLLKKVKNVDFVGFSFFTFGTADALYYTRLVKEANPNVKTVLGGPHASFEYSRLMKYKSVDYCVIGEGEEALSSLVKKGPEKVSGVVFRRKKRIVVNPPQIVNDLDSLPLPARNNFLRGDYKYDKIEHVLSSRGCPVNCVFCSESRLFPGIRFRKPSLVVDEIQLLHQKGVRKFDFVDSNFSIHWSHLRDICDEIIKREITFNLLKCNISVEHTTYEKLVKLKEAGFTHVFIGVESLTPETISYVKKTLQPSSYRRRAVKLIKLAKKLGFVVTTFFILGFPFQTAERAEKEISLLKKLADRLFIFSITPHPGTILWEEYKHKDKIEEYYKLYYHYSLYNKEILMNKSNMSNEEMFNIASSLSLFTRIKNHLTFYYFSNSSK
jgi:radical SAM superfamily enzyme YgiQ (UPF0313 family)